MDAFGIIQQFFTRMACRFCDESFIPNDIRLIDETDGFFIVAVHCHECGRHNGDAAVGFEAFEGSENDTDDKAYLFKDPEFTETDLERLNQFDTINDDDVLNAHHFIRSLKSDWMQFIPEEIRQQYTGHETESPALQSPDDLPTDDPPAHTHP